MKEHIKQIMIDNQENQPDSDFYDYDRTAKEIADHFERFDHWKLKNCEVSLNNKLWSLFDYDNQQMISAYTNKELYTYWKDNFET